jgi:hypothetical protein
MDCWSFHSGVDFRYWMSKNHPRILVLSMPANCTTKFQHANVFLQQPFKHAFVNLLKCWSTKDNNNNWVHGVRFCNKMNYSMDTICENAMKSLFLPWNKLCELKEMIASIWA